MKNPRIDRRSVLALGASVCTLPWAGPALALEKEEPSLGFSLYGMKSLSLDAALKACSEIGFRHVELSLNAGYPTEPSAFTADARKATSAKLKEYRLEVPCMMVLMHLVADDQAHARSLQLIASAAELGRDLVSDHPPILETILGGSPAKWNEQKTEMVDRLRDWARTAEASRTVLALKAHVSSAVNSPERLLWLVDQVPSPRLCWPTTIATLKYKDRYGRIDEASLAENEIHPCQR